MSGKKAIHVVAFDVPFPPDYGGVTDVYYRCRTLKNAGYRVILHCFEYGRGRNHDHAGIADEVCYYSRRKSWKDMISKMPFIVATRNNPALLERLNQDDHPILFEGQHTTFLLDHPALKQRKKIVRLHNIEWQYYAGLAVRTNSIPKRLFFRIESRKLRNHESVLKHAGTLACISHSDREYYAERFEKAAYVPVGFELYPKQEEPLDRPPFVLFHGNLSVEENREAAEWLLKAFATISADYELVIAGKNPGESLKTSCGNQPNVSLVANPDQQLMNRLIQSASAHLAIGFQHSGIKLKLLNALISGQPCIATPQMVAGSGLEDFCTIVKTAEDFRQAIREIQPLSEMEKQARISRLRMLFSEAELLRIID
jgi:glycosyltransferase involved in cell wall biosynthesis